MNDFLKTLSGHKTDKPPVWLMRQAGRYLPEYRAARAQVPDFMSAVFVTPLATEITMQPIKRYPDLDAAIIFSDILVIPYALGMDITFSSGDGPRLSGLPEDPASFKFQLEKLDPVLEAISEVRAQLPPEKTMIGFAGSPWTIACYMISGHNYNDFLEAKRWALGDPDRLDALLEPVIKATIDYLIAQIKAGAQVIQLFDSWAGLLAGHPDRFERFVINPTRRIVAEIRKTHPNTPIIGFPRQVGTFLPWYAAETKVTALGLDWSVDLAWADKILPPGLPVQGNLDPCDLLVGGDIMKRETEKIIQALANRPFIFNLGHGVIPATPPEHVADLLRLVKA